MYSVPASAKMKMKMKNVFLEKIYRNTYKKMF